MREHEVTLTTYAYGGAAMGRLADGRAVFVPFALPGEQVRVRLVEEKRGYAHAELVTVVQPSPERIPPCCRHFGLCGGCHYQHLPYEAQLRAKQEILAEQLRRLGGVERPPLRPIVPSPKPWNYRNHVQFHLDAQGRLAYVAAKAEKEGERPLLAITECHLPEEALNAFWPTLQFDAALDLERVALRLGEGEELLLILEANSPQPPALELETSASVVHLFEGEALVLAGREYLFLKVRQRLFRLSAASFFQVNTAVAEHLVEHVLALLPERLGEVWDLYCGVGLFSAFLAARATALKGVELSPSAGEDFAWNLDEFDNVSFYQGAVEEVLPLLEGRPQVILADPPRAGLAPQVLDGIVARRPRYLVYISCDPATLARDTRRLIRQGYRLEQVTPFDMFPQTYHIESVALFVPS